MHNHIAIIGKQQEPVVNGIRAISGIDRVYLLFSRIYEDIAKETKALLQTMGYKCEITKIDGFDFQEIVDKIFKIYEETNEKGVEYSINITGGTNLMAAAACSTAFITGAKLYYILFDKNNPDQPLNERVVEIPIPKVRNVDKFKENERLILTYLYKHERGRNIDIANGTEMSPQLCGRYIEGLEKEGLIEVERSSNIGGKRDGRSHTVMLTKQGRMVASWLGDY